RSLPRDLVLRDSADPPHIVRWVDGERLLVTGADSESPPDRQLEKVIVQRTGQLMYELSTLYPEISGIAPEYGWDAAYARTDDGLPYIGPHRNYPHHLFAFGDASHSVTGTKSCRLTRSLDSVRRDGPGIAGAARGFLSSRPSCLSRPSCP